MSASNLIRAGGLAAMVGGVLFLAGSLVDLAGYLLALYPGLYPVLYDVALVVALLLVPVGMVGFHALQTHSYGRIGSAGFWLVVVGSLVVLAGGVVFFTLGESGDFLQASPPLVWVGLGLLGLVVGTVNMVVGFALYGVATLRARVLPRWCGVAFIAALPVALASSVLCTVLFALVFNLWDFLLYFSGASKYMMFGLAWLALGYALWTRREASAVQQPRRVR